MSPVKKLCLCAMCIALCPTLPMALHPLGLGAIVSPMHIPALLCGLLVSAPYGLLCGLLGPLLGHLTNGMPPMPGLIFMTFELAAYGFFSGLFLKLIHTGKVYADLYAAMIPAMLLGRIVGGAAKAVFLLSGGNSWTFSLFIADYFVQTAPGALIHLIVIPTVVVLLMKARLVPQRYTLAHAQ